MSYKKMIIMVVLLSTIVFFSCEKSRDNIIDQDDIIMNDIVDNYECLPYCIGKCDEADDGCGGKCSTQCGENAHCIKGARICACNEGFDDCDKNMNNGCEVNLMSDPQNCGRCNNKCLPNTFCNNGVCDCNPGFTDCNNNPIDGCETNLKDDLKNCGKCGQICNPINVENIVCNSGMCYDKCKLPYIDGDNNRLNGCEEKIRLPINFFGGESDSVVPLFGTRNNENDYLLFGKLNSGDEPRANSLIIVQEDLSKIQAKTLYKEYPFPPPENSLNFLDTSNNIYILSDSGTVMSTSKPPVLIKINKVTNEIWGREIRSKSDQDILRYYNFAHIDGYTAISIGVISDERTMKESKAVVVVDDNGDVLSSIISSNDISTPMVFPNQDEFIYTSYNYKDKKVNLYILKYSGEILPRISLKFPENIYQPRIISITNYENKYVLVLKYRDEGHKEHLHFIGIENNNILFEKNFSDSYQFESYILPYKDSLFVNITNSNNSVIYKLDISGELQWAKLLSGATNFNVDSKGELIITSRTYGLFRLNSDGQLIDSDCSIITNTSINLIDQHIVSIDNSDLYEFTQFEFQISNLNLSFSDTNIWFEPSCK